MKPSFRFGSEDADQLRQQEVVADLGRRALGDPDLDALLDDATTAVTTALEVDRTAAFELVPEDEDLVLRAGVGWREGLVDRATVPALPSSPTGHTLRSDRPLVLTDLHDDRFHVPVLLGRHCVTSSLTVPVGTADDPWGVLGVFPTTEREFADHEVAFLQNVANVLAGAVETARTRRRLQEEIAQREERERELARFERAVEASGHAIYMTDTDGVITYVNSAFEDITGYSAEEAVGETQDFLQSDAHDESYYRQLRETVLAGDVWQEEIVDRRKCGERYYAEQTIAPVADEDGEIDRFIAVHTDVSDRKRREEALEESNERLEQFAYAASHDLQEPLRMVSSYLQLVDARYGEALDEEGQEYLEYAVDGAERMRAMIEGLLQYSRVETEGSPFEPVALNDVVDAALDDLQVKIDESDADVAVGALPTVEGDPHQLRQVFQNLLSNAIKYSGDEPPRVEITADRREGRHVIAVRDEGIGIDADEADRVFDVFQRLHSHSSHAGAGIGLAITERIVERHGGELWVESEAGEGSTFYVSLPLRDAETGH